MKAAVRWVFDGREQIEESVRARFAAEETDLQRIAGKPSTL